MKLLLFNDLDWFGLIWPLLMYKTYGTGKDSNPALGVIFKFLQNPPISKAVCTKIFFCLFIDSSERK